MTGPYQLYRDLTPPIEAALRASIDRFGVLVRVVKDQHGNILDGHQRVRIADELGVGYPSKVMEVANEDEAREIARTLNEDRRAMPRKERLQVVKVLREQGHSVRAIAGAVGVGTTTVHRDLTAVPPGTAERVTGLDGKSYPAQKKPAAQRVAQIKALADEGHSVRQIAVAIGVGEERVRALIKTHGVGVPADMIRNSHRLNNARIVTETVSSLEGVALGVSLLGDSLGIDPEHARQLAKSLDRSLRVVSRLARQLRRIAQ